MQRTNQSYANIAIGGIHKLKPASWVKINVITFYRISQRKKQVHVTVVLMVAIIHVLDFA